MVRSCAGIFGALLGAGPRHVIQSDGNIQPLYLMQWILSFDPFLEGTCQLSSYFLAISPPILKGLVPILQHLCWIFWNPPTPFLMDFRGVMAMAIKLQHFIQTKQHLRSPRQGSWPWSYQGRRIMHGNWMIFIDK